MVITSFVMTAACSPQTESDITADAAITADGGGDPETLNGDTLNGDTWNGDTLNGDVTLEDTMGSAAPIGQAVSCGKATKVGGLQAGTGLFRVTLGGSKHPKALCNDGSPAVMFVRRASVPSQSKRWVIHLQGGGSCRDAQSCLNRWCAIDTNFGKQKMSSVGVPKGVVGGGINSPSEDNPLRGWNHVLLYYCSSDLWSGAHYAPNLATEGRASVSFEMHFRGLDIIRAALTSLGANGDALTTYTDASGAKVTLPDLDEAEQVLIAGGSAGGAGVALQLDRIAKLLAPAEVIGIHDSLFGLQLWKVGWKQTPMCTVDQQCSYEAFQSEEGESARQFWGAQVDSSCQQWHADNAPSQAYRCMDPTWTLLNHITTPVFVRMDLGDKLISGNAVEAGFTTGADQAPLTKASFAKLVSQGLAELSQVQQTAVEGASIAKAPGYFGTWCGDHETLGGNQSALAMKAPNPDGKLVTMLEMLAQWRAAKGSYGGVVSAKGQGCP